MKSLFLVVFLVSSFSVIYCKHVFSLSKTLHKSTLSVLASLPLICQISMATEISNLDSLRNVLRVEYSLKYIEQDFEKIANMPKIINSIKALQRNYKLQDNIAKTMELIPASNEQMKNEARVHGKFAIEDLTLIYEYFSDQVDDITGLPKTTPETLKFAYQAIKAAENELSLLISAIPREVKDEVVKEIQNEFASSSN